MNPPPTYIDGARVIEWAWSDLAFGELYDSDSSIAVKIQGLAICQYSYDSQVYRFSCNDCWETYQDQVYDCFEGAKKKLPTQYRLVAVDWQSMNDRMILNEGSIGY